MNIDRVFLSEKSQAELETFINQYFKTNGYYYLTVKDGLKFSTYMETTEKVPLHPKRLNHDISVKFFPNGKGQKIVLKLDMEKWGSYGIKSEIDKEYFLDFITHFEKALETGEITKFDTSSYVKRAKGYTKTFYLVSVILLVVLLLSILFFREHIDIGFMFVLFLTIQGSVIYYVNYREKQKAKLAKA